jgi:two-component system NtrC family sensor kinase
MKERVLVVDDSKEVRNFLSEYILKPRGFEVLLAANGLEGLALAVSKKPGLLILDVQMPRLGGLDLLQRLKERGVEIPTIMMSAHGSEQVAVAGFRLGIRDYVIKPFDVDEMDAAIDRALREDRLRNERNDLIQQLTETNAHVKRRLQELNILYGIGRSVSSALDMAEVLNRVVEAGVYVANADEGALLLAGEETGTLYVQAT